MAPPERFAGRPLEWLLEALDEEYGSPDEPADPTDAMLAAEASFIRAVMDEYEAWQCEIVEIWRVRVLEYVDAEWLRLGEAPDE